MKRLLILCSLIFALAFAGRAEPTAEQISAVVRIMALHPPEQVGDKTRHAVGGGTGFVINNDGLIMTNNHVIASKAEVADHPYIYMVVQKIGERVIVYRATFVAQDPNADLAVIRCEGIKATPFQFLTPPPKVLEDVYSLGFPGVADADQVPVIQLAEALDARLKQQGATSLDITDDAQKDKLLKDFFVPTAPPGKVERLTDLKWVNEVLPFIQHSCNIRHGNSGGPLLNGGGQVVGVVGDGFSGDDGDQAKFALQTSQVEKFLQTNGINGCNITDKAWAPPPISKTNILPIIIAASLAIAVALAALLVTLIKGRRRTGMTALVESLRKKGISSGTQLLEMISGRGIPRSDGSPARSAVLPTPKGGNWKLDGRTSAGKTFQIPISESMFATNSSRLVLGRSRDLCDLVVEDETVSRQHAEIRKNGTGFLVADRNSSNGTAVNGVFNRKPFEPVPFKPGDTLTIGDVKLDFR
jgi:hypothetical protein